MKKQDCLKWAEALINGKYKKLRAAMSNRKVTEPTACCCLGVANELFQVCDFKSDRKQAFAIQLSKTNVFGSMDPLIFGEKASLINDGDRGWSQQLTGIPSKGLTHPEIGLLLLLAIETGEYRNI